MRRFLLSIIFFAVYFSSEAQQLRIVKDNINCAYGLKDTNGEWVIDPIYVLIQEYNSGYFQLSDGSVDGLMTPTGKWLLKCEYIEIDVSLANWRLLTVYDQNSPRMPKPPIFFICGIKKDGEKYLFNSKGEVIHEMTYNDRCIPDGREHFIIQKRSPNTFSYIDTSGNTLIDQKQGKLLPFAGRDYTLIGDHVQVNDPIVSGNVRLINAEGEQMIDQTFDRAVFLNPNEIAFELDSKYGLMNTKGEVIIEPKFKREIALGTGVGQPREGWVIVDSLNRKGIMKADGTILVQPKFDLIYLASQRNEREKLWVLKANDKFGAIDVEGRTLIPIDYDRITSFYRLDKNKNIYETNFVVEREGQFAFIDPRKDSIPLDWFDSLYLIHVYDYGYSETTGLGIISKRNGKYGILNPDGSEHMPCIFDNYNKRGSYQDRFYFFSDTVLKEVIFRRDEIIERSWSTFLRVKNESIFTDGNAFIFVRYSKDGKRIVSLEARDRSNSLFGNVFVFDTDSKGSLLIYNHVTGKKVDLQNITSISHAINDRFLVRTDFNNVGVINENGLLILDTLYKSVQFNNNAKYIWAAKQDSYSGYKWQLFDIDGAKVMSTLFDQTFDVNAGDQLVRQKNRIGLMDTKTIRWKIKPTHPCLIKVFDEYYATINLEGKKGIIRSNGSYVIRPVYDSIIMLTSNCYPGNDLTHGKPAEIRWLAKKGSQQFMIDQNGRIVSDKSTMNQLKRSLLFDDTLLLEQQIVSKNFPVLDYSPSLHFLRGLTIEQIRRKRGALWQNPKLKKAVFDIVNSEWEARKANCNSMYGFIVVGNESKNEERIQKMCNCTQTTFSNYWSYSINYKLRSIGKRFVTVSREYQQNYDQYLSIHGQGRSAPVSGVNQNWSFVIRQDKVVPVELKTIFPNDSVLMEEFIVALQKRDDLKLECSSVENMIEMINGKFSLSSTGVRLSLNQYAQTYNGSSAPIELLIPLENLSLHEESRWIVPILEQR